jgi:hypothetical protein
MLDTRTNCASTKATKRCKRLGGWCGAAASAAGCMSCNNVEGGGKSSCKVLRPPVAAAKTNALKASQMLQFCNVTDFTAANCHKIQLAFRVSCHSLPVKRLQEGDAEAAPAGGKRAGRL